MREIKFRGLRADGDGWVYGDLETRSDWTPRRISDIDNTVDEYPYVDIIPSTVGQFTGLLDKNGRKIYEGDRVRYKTSVKYDSLGNSYYYDGVVEFWNGQMGCGWRYKSGSYTIMIKRSHTYRMEVIGNIHEQIKS